jgi:curved DNA-binding protein CbpA
MRKRRLHPRYLTDLHVQARTLPKGEPREFQVKDISIGGMFLNTAEPFEIMSNVEIRVEVPGEGAVALAARVVHILSARKAADLSIQPGMGAQFEVRDETDMRRISALVEEARKNDPSRRVPVAVAGASPPADLDPMLGYVLSGVDGSMATDDLAERLALDHDVAERLVSELEKMGLVEFVRDRSWKGVLERKAAPQPAAAVTARGEPLPTRQVPGEFAAGDAPTRAELQHIVDSLSGQNHYEALNVSRRAAYDEVRTAYFDLTRTFHPESSRGVRLGMDRGQLEQVFQRITEAYAVLGHRRLREEYDEYIDRHAQLEELERGLEAGDETGEARPAKAAPAVAEERSATVPGAPARGEAASKKRRVKAPPKKKKAAPSKALADDLRRSIADASRLSGVGTDLVGRSVTQARVYLDKGNLIEAAKVLQLLSALEIRDEKLRAEYRRVSREVSGRLADSYEKQALYEEKNQKWDRAARSWARVFEGRPHQAESAWRAANALVEARGDMYRAKAFAEKAVELSPDDHRGHQVLGRVFMAIGMSLNARREMEEAARLRMKFVKGG